MGRVDGPAVCMCRCAVHVRRSRPRTRNDDGLLVGLASSAMSGDVCRTFPGLLFTAHDVSDAGTASYPPAGHGKRSELDVAPLQCQFPKQYRNTVLYSCDNLQGACKAQASYPVYSNSNNNNNNRKTTMPQTRRINLSDADFNAALVTAIPWTVRLRGCDLLHDLPARTRAEAG
eukprot:COSAG01_NODE_2723_length_7183_cov_9.443111_3_plen_174_part_00